MLREKRACARAKPDSGQNLDNKRAVGIISQPTAAGFASSGTGLLNGHVGQVDSEALRFGFSEREGLVKDIAVVNDRASGGFGHEPNSGLAKRISPKVNVHNVRVLAGEGELVAEFDGDDAFGESMTGLADLHGDRGCGVQSMAGEAVVVAAACDAEEAGEEEG